MVGVEKEKIAVKIYRLAEVTDRDWKIVMPKYGKQLKEWSITPTGLWYLLLLLGVIAVVLNWYPPWIRFTGILAALYGALQIGSRSGDVNGFQIGYEWGKEDGICKAMGITDEEKDGIFDLARQVILEFKLGSGDPNLKVGEKWRDGPG